MAMVEREVIQDNRQGRFVRNVLKRIADDGNIEKLFTECIELNRNGDKYKLKRDVIPERELSFPKPIIWFFDNPLTYPYNELNDNQGRKRASEDVCIEFGDKYHYVTTQWSCEAKIDNLIGDFKDLINYVYQGTYEIEVIEDTVFDANKGQYVQKFVIGKLYKIQSGQN